jgi:FKBP-type peptidyl-prolyl cis-trans isomerase FklB
MHKSFTAAVNLLAAGMLLMGNALAQQTPAATTPPATPKAQTPAAKAHPATAAKSAAPVTLNTQKEKFSYALGMNMGKRMADSLTKQSVPFDPALLARGLKDGMAGGKTLLTEQEAQAVMDEVRKEVEKRQQEAQKVQQEKMQEVGAANKKEGDAFLAANKAKDGVVTLPSGLQYKILKEGTGPKPTTTDSVVCNYRGTLINGTEFDSSYKSGQPVTFPVTGVIKGWTEALQLMGVGSKWQLFIPSDLAYGPNGRPPIEPNATLIFEVELLSIEDKSKDKDKAPDKDEKK